MFFGDQIRLYTIEQVPKFQQHNPFIIRGYRAYLSAKDCLRSVTIWSNEFLNVWSHVATFFFFLYLLAADQLLNIPQQNGTSTDHLVFLIFHVSCLTCMLFSSAYHTFNCHLHRQVAQSWLNADLFGITAAMLGCYAIGLYYGFYCQEALRTGYLAVSSCVICVSMFVMLIPKYSSDSWQVFRVAHLTAITLMGVCPVVNWVYVSPTYEIHLILPRIMTFYLILGVAMLFYLSRFPERVSPGRFDFIGQSHTLWHVFISLSLLYWRSFALDLVGYRTYDECMCKDCADPRSV